MIRRALFLVPGLAVLIATLCAGAGEASAEETKIGVVDMQRALMETEDGRKAKAKLKKEFERKQKELDERSQNLKVKIEDLQKKRTLLPEQTRLQKEGELQQEMQQVQQIYMRMQQDLAKKEQEATRPILQKMTGIIQKIAGEGGFTVILDRTQSGLVFAKPHLDLTNELIRRYNDSAAKPRKKSSKK